MNIKKRILSLCIAASMLLCNNSFYLPFYGNTPSLKKVQAADTTTATATNNQLADDSITVTVTNGQLTDGIYSDRYITIFIETKNLTDTTYRINNCTPVSFTGEVELTIGEDTEYGEETTFFISGTSAIDSKTPVEKTYTYQRSASPCELQEQKENDGTLRVRVKKSQFDSAPYLYLYTVEDGMITEPFGTWPGTQMVEEGNYYVIGSHVQKNVHAVLSCDTWRSTYEDEEGPLISGNVIYDKKTKTFTPYDIASEYGTVKVQFQNESGEILKEITRVNVIGSHFYLYAPETLSTVSDYVFSSDLNPNAHWNGNQFYFDGSFTKEEQLYTFIYTKKQTATTTETPTSTPDEESSTSTPGGTLTTEIPTSTSPNTVTTEIPTSTSPDTITTEIPTSTPTDTVTTEVPTPTPTNIPTATPTNVPTPTPTNIPTATPTNVPTATPTNVPTAVPEPTAYAPLSANGTKYTVTLHPRGGTLGKDTLSVTQGTTYGTLPIPSRTGYTFEGWFTSMEEGQQPITKDSLVNLAANQDLYAKWKANTYTITFDADGGTVDVTSLPVTYGQTYPELPIPHKENALFSGWYTQDGTYVNEYNIFNIASDLTLTAEWQTAFRRADIGPLSFSFENSSVGFSYEDNYRPRLEIYQYIYGNTLKAKKMFTQQSTWSGSCFGMGAAALFFYVGTTDNLQYDDFNASARAINQLEPTDVNQNLNLSLTKLIEVMHVIQHDSYILSKRDKNMNQLDTLCEKVMDSQENKGNPILIYMWGVDDKGNAGGHAVIGYNLVNGLLYIYDPNYPSDASRYITIGKDANGNSTWSYKLNKQYDWGTGQEGAAISFVTYEDLKQGWEQCRMFQYAIGKSGTNSLILSTKNANIYNSNGVLMASIIEGELESKYEDICKIIPNTVVNSQSASSLEIHLPSGEYIIENTDPFSTEFTAEMMNLQQCATVTTQAKKVTVCVNDEERTNFVICHANENQTYSIRLESSIEGDKESIERTGTGNSNHYIGVSQSEGVEKELHYVKNTPISYPVTISANEGGTVTCNETAVSSSEQEPLQATYGTNLTFAITPNEGYVISNVFVDDTDMGPVATYMLENITAAHSIRIVFSPKTVDTTKPKIQLTVDQLPSFNYTGKEILPSVTVRSGELILEENIDYIAHYRNNTKVGTAYVDIIGINAYNGLEATTISFKILPAKGKIYTINGLKYKLTDLKGKKVTLTGVSKKTLSSVTIMKEIKIGNTSYKVTTIGAKAFENCKKLKKIVISNTELKAIGKNAFKGISSKAVIKVPASKYKVYTKLLKNKGQSKTVLIKK